MFLLNDIMSLRLEKNTIKYFCIKGYYSIIFRIKLRYVTAVLTTWNIVHIFINHFLQVNPLLTSPKVLMERSKNFPALSFAGTIDVAIINISARAFAFGRRYQANVHTVNANFSP